VLSLLCSSRKKCPYFKDVTASVFFFGNGQLLQLLRAFPGPVVLSYLFHQELDLI